MACVVRGCRSHTSRRRYTNGNELVTFHRFPKDDELKDEWITLIGRGNWTPKEHSHICSKHFHSDSFIINENTKWRRLKHNAVPTLYEKAEIAQMITYTDFPPIKLETDTCDPLDDSESAEDVIYSENCTFQEPTLIKEETEYFTSDPLDESKSEQDVKYSQTSTFQSLEPTIQTAKETKSEINYTVTIAKLEKELERTKEVSKRRLCRIKVLNTRLSRLRKKHEILYEIARKNFKDDVHQIEYFF